MSLVKLAYNIEHIVNQFNNLDGKQREDTYQKLKNELHPTVLKEFDNELSKQQAHWKARAAKIKGSK